MLVGLVTASLLMLPLAPVLAEGLRVRVCRGTGGSCGYQPVTTRCTVLSRDSGVASSLTVLRSQRIGALTVDKLVDGTATVTLAGDRRDALGSNGSEPLESLYHFTRHDDADAWVDRYREVGDPVVEAPAGPRASGLAEGVRRTVAALGFRDPATDREPDAVVLDVPAQAAAAGSYLAASGPARPVAVASRPRLTLEPSGRTTTTGSLATARNQDEIATSLATRLGLVADARYAVSTDPTGRPERLVVSGEAGQDVDGDVLAATSLPQIREQGASRGRGALQAAIDRRAGVRTFQSVVLDLRSESNRRAFARVFLPAGALNAARSAPLVRLPRSGLVVVDAQRSARAVDGLVARLAGDAVLLRETRRDTADGSVLVSAFSEDFAVPASRLTALPGCSQ